MERSLKLAFGKTLKLGDVKDHLVCITATKFDQRPIKGVLFKNYDDEDLCGSIKDKPVGQVLTNPEYKHLNGKDLYLWEAVRCSSAAPLYFTPKGIYLDGGMVNNNPTSAILTEISRINSLRKRNNW